MDSGTYQTFCLQTQANGVIVGKTSTNDNADLGEPGEVETWDVSYPDYETMKRRTGLSHVGINGCRVRVSLDGRWV